MDCVWVCLACGFCFDLFAMFRWFGGLDASVGLGVDSMLFCVSLFGIRWMPVWCC